MVQLKLKKSPGFGAFCVEPVLQKIATEIFQIITLEFGASGSVQRRHMTHQYPQPIDL